MIDPCKTVSALVAGLAVAAAALLGSVPGAAAQSPAFLVRDVDARFAPQSSNPNQFVALDDTTFFTAAAADTGTELWRSDGSAAGTVLVKDVNPARRDPAPAR